jgi:hypothetical protein
MLPYSFKACWTPWQSVFSTLGQPWPRFLVAFAAEEGFEVAVLMTMGELASVAGQALHGDVLEILPLVIDAIQDGGSQTKRLVAVSTLGQVGAAVAGILEFKM